MAVKPRIDVEAALAASDPLMALRAAVKTELDDPSVDREDVVALLRDAMLELRAADREQDEDVVTNVIDFVVGWCRPAMRL